MQLDLPILRIGLYGGLILFSFILFCLSAARLNYTTRGNSTKGGRVFYDPIVVEILITTLLTIPWSIFIGWSIHKRYENRYLSTFRGEIIGLSILWIFWIAGAAGASHPWGSLSWCQQFEACRILSALVAFSWLGWLTLSTILGLSLLFSLANKALMEPLHGRWNPRQTIYKDNFTRM